jgi:hypothetical protein
MNLSSAFFFAVFLAYQPSSTHACPFSETAGGEEEMPNDSTHQRLLRRRRLASLSEDESTRLKIASIISEQKRSLQNEACVTNNIYEGIRTTIGDMANSIADLGDRGHFMGGIVRLAAVSSVVPAQYQMR